MANREERSYCRICTGYCGLVLTVDDEDHLVDVKGDRAHPMSDGYACIKGLQSAHLYNGPQRLLNPLKRQPDGSYSPVPLDQALNEIADKLAGILARDGAEAVGLYQGGTVESYAITAVMHRAFMAAIGSPSFFTVLTIDQSAKAVAADRIGSWHAGKDHFHIADTIMIFGGNPLVGVGMFGFDLFNPVKKLKAFKARGGKLIVIDPRKSETAQFADVFLQSKPGEDVSVAAGMLRIIIDEGWHDRDFCERYVSQMEELRRAVDPFTPDYVAMRADISADALREAAAVFAKAKRAYATSGTGPSMAPRSNLAQHLIECLNVVCGRFLREGDLVPHPGLIRPRPWRAEVVPPTRCWEQGPKSRVRGLGMLFGEKFSGVLAQEITTPGPGQIRALIVDGGNPATAVPDQRRIVDALKSLELLVVIDPEMSTTARVADYILPPKLNFEHANVAGSLTYEAAFFQKPFQQYGAPILKTPAGSELVEDWYIFWALAKRLGKPIVFDGIALDMDRDPDPQELLRLLFRNARVSFDDVKAHPEGRIYDFGEIRVEPASTDARFEVAAPDIGSELADVAAEQVKRIDANAPVDLHLISRRIRDVFNSGGRSSPELRRRQPYNAAYVHPDTLARLGIAAGDRVEIKSDNGRIPAIVQPDAALRRDVVSMAHGWGGLPEEELDYLVDGACTGLLISTESDCEPINAMPRQSAIPVSLRRIALGA